MSKYILPQIVCVCLFLFSSYVLCDDDEWFIERLRPEVFWGHGGNGIPILLPLNARYDDTLGWDGGGIVSDLDLSGRDLRGARVRLYGTLRNCKFDNANLEGADFGGTILENCSFKGANLRYVKMYQSKDCDMTDAILSGIVGNLTAEQIRSTWNFKNKDFSNTVFNNCTFPDMVYDSSFNFTRSGGDSGMIPVNKFKFDDCPWARLPLAFFPSHAIDDGRPGWWYTRWLAIGEPAFRTQEFKLKSLHELAFYSIDFHDCDFSEFTFGFFDNCRFQNANFKDVRRLIFLSYNEHGSLVPSGKFGFKNCNVTKEQIEQTLFWKEGDLSGIILEDMNLDGWDFSNKDLSYASLKGSSVRGANFENAVLYYTDLDVLGMTDTGLLQEELIGEERYKLRQWASTLTIEQLKATNSWKTKRIAFCSLKWINFDDCDLSGFNLTGTRLAGCSFNNANLAGADADFVGNIIGSKGLTEKQVRSLKGFKEEWLPLKE